MKGILYLITAGIMLASSLQAQAQQPVPPRIPDQRFDVTEFGAKGDGAFINTSQIQAALDKASASGGTVVIPQGVFLTGPLVLHGRTGLLLRKGAFLKLRNEIDSIPVEEERYLNFITISKGSDVKISGEGTIDGQGQIWWDKFTARQLLYRRPQMVYGAHIERLELEGVTFLNPPNTHVSLKDCREVYIHGITIDAPEKSRNTDGLNLSVKNCLIEDCNIRTGDDNIAINFGNRTTTPDAPECENITIRNCTFGYGHGLSIGSFTSGGLRNMTVSHCTFKGTSCAVRIKTARGRGGVVENVRYADLQISDVKWPVFISEYYPKEPETPQADSLVATDRFTPVYRNISLSNIHATNAGDAIRIWGVPESPITGVTFTDVTIDARKGVQIYHAKDIRFEHTTVNVREGDKIRIWNATVQGLSQ